MVTAAVQPYTVTFADGQEVTVRAGHRLDAAKDAKARRGGKHRVLRVLQARPAEGGSPNREER
jgi:hypothetical protein